jgi:hypothetical protein
MVEKKTKSYHLENLQNTKCKKKKLLAQTAHQYINFAVITLGYRFIRSTLCEI